MSYAEVISTISLLFSFLAITINAYPHIRDYGDKSDEKRKAMIDILTKTQWSNEGDIYTTPKAHYTLSLTVTSGISRIHGTLRINLDEREYYFHGMVNKKGIFNTKIIIPLGKNGMYIAKARFKYIKEDDQLLYTFLGFICTTEDAAANSILDTKQYLWRRPN